MIKSFSRTLSNGLRCVAVEMPHLHSVELALYIKVGGRDDPADKSGITHFLEHMIFRGTRDFPTTLEIETAFEEIGGNINASTDEECTCFFTRLHPGHLQRGIEILSSMLLHPLLDGIAIEKKIIAEEALDDLNERGEEINPHNLASRLLWPDHPLGRPTIGTLESIASFTINDLLTHMSTYYQPLNSVLVAAGNFRHNELFESASQYFSDWTGISSALPFKAVSTQNVPQSFFVSDADSQAHLQIAFRSVSRNDPRIMPIRLLRRILSGSGSARLHMNLREKLGIVYSVDANMAAYEETGSFSIELSTAQENLSQAVAEVFSETFRLAECQVPTEELNRVRQSYFFELDYSKDSGYEMQVRYGWGELMDHVKRIEDDMAIASTITSKELQTIARQIFQPTHLNLIVVGAWSDLDKSNVLAAIDAYTAKWAVPFIE